MLKTLSMAIVIGIPYHSFCKNTVPEFTAVYDSRKKTVKIKWQNELPGTRSFTIQRSSDNLAWTDIAFHEIKPNSTTKTFYFEDKKPAAGDNYYRLKYIDLNAKTGYTMSVMVIVGSPDHAWVMYPVPVGDVLTLQYKGAEIIKGVIMVLIQNSSGNIITRVRSSSLTKLIRIPVNNLGRGFYDVRIIVEDEIIWSQRFVK